MVVASEEGDENIHIPWLPILGLKLECLNADGPSEEGVRPSGGCGPEMS